MIKKTLCFSNSAYLSTRLGQMVIRLTETNGEKKELTRPIEDLGIVIIESHAVTITSALLSRLLDNNVAVIICNNNHLPSGLLLNLDGNTLQSERFQAQVASSLPLRKQLWQQTVTAKILNQATILKRHTKTPTDGIFTWAMKVRSGDPDNLEARAAVFYWKHLFPIENFRRNPEGDSPNHLLNYGYSILRAMTARALVGSGLLPTLGLHHHNRYNAYCLADDIMEPYRPYVDRLVLELVHKHGMEIALDPATKKHLLTLPVIDVRIDGQTRPMMIAIQTTAASLAKCFTGEQRKLLYPTID